MKRTSSFSLYYYITLIGVILLSLCFSKVNGETKTLDDALVDIFENEFDDAPKNVTWDWTDCIHGHYVSNLTHYFGYCVCDPGWNGTDCSLCLNDTSCGDGYTCDKSPVIEVYKAYNCFASIQGLGAVTAQFNYPANSTYGTGVVSAWNLPDGSPFLFNCTFDQCTKEIKGGQQIMSCAQSSCLCSDWCSWFLAPIIPKINGLSEFKCDLDDNNCYFSPGMNGTVVQLLELQCNYAGCQATPYIPPPPLLNYWQVILVVGGGFIFISAIITLVTLLCCLVRRRNTRLYLQTKFEQDLRVSVAFEDVCCTIKTGGGERQILKNVSGVCLPGQLTAILGPSGAGKTSFLDILAGRKNIGKITGDVLFNGQVRQKNFQRIAGYVLQDEKLIGTLTVREHLTFVALLKLPAPMPYEEKIKKVDAVISELNIEHIRDSKIGTDMTRGISGGEKRRVAIASELVTDPQVLFLDEPTSGLDSTSAFALVQTLIALSRNKSRTIITTIHQPSSNIYQLFDNVMLLANGKTVYYGAAGDALDYFEALGHNCPKNYNPADFLLDMVATNSQDVVNTLSNVYNESSKANNTMSPIPNIQSNRRGSIKSHKRSASENNNLFEIEHLREEYASYWIDQVYVLGKRTLLNNLRNPSLLRLQYLSTVALGIFLGLIFYRLIYDERGTQDRLGALFFLISLLTFSTMSSIDLFFQDRGIFVRERATGMYSTSSYFITKAICDIIPMRVIPAIILGAIPYYMINLHHGISHFFVLISVLVLLSIVAVSLCFALSTIAPTVSFANLLGIIFMLFNMLFGGFLINKSNIPKFISWIQYTSFLNYAYEILCVNEFVGVTIDFDPVDVPVGKTSLMGIIILEQFDMSPARVPRDFICLGGMALLQLTVSYLFLRFFIKERR